MINTAMNIRGGTTKWLRKQKQQAEAEKEEARVKHTDQ